MHFGETVMISNETKEELISGLQNIFRDKLVSIILYGSMARGDADDESDIDIAFIIRSGIEDDEKNSFLKWNAALDLKYGRVFSIVDIDKDTMDKWGAVVPYFRNINSEGVVLWKAA